MHKESDGVAAPRYGSIGMAVSSPSLTIEVSDDSSFHIHGEASDRVEQFVRLFCEQQRVEPVGRWTVSGGIPEHQGLGSGTQTALATGYALAKLHGLSADCREIGGLAQRGSRSGIGIGAFERGGFLVDGGKHGNRPPAIVTRLEVPDTWRVLLIERLNTAGLHGHQERVAFDELPEFSPRCVRFLKQTLTKDILPALSEADFDHFAGGLMRFQDTMGDYFAAVQQSRYADSRVAQVLEYLRRQGITGVGQSSWGPTGFVFTRSQSQAESIVRQIHAEFPETNTQASAIKLRITRANNQGAYLS